VVGKINSLDKKLQSFVNDIVKKDSSIFNATLAVSSGNGNYDWSGAAGIASQKDSIVMTTETPFFIASITKMFTATAIMKLIQDKEIKLNDPIVNYLPNNLVNGIHNYKGIDYTDKITIEHLLSHTSGIADYFLDKNKKGKNFIDIILNEPKNPYTVDQTIAIARDELHAHFEPGKKAKYSDTNYQLLGKIIEEITGKELHQIYQDYFFVPLKMNSTWLFGKSKPIKKITHKVADFYFDDQVVSNNRPFESSWADGGLISTTKDSIIFLKALFAGEIIDNKTTLPMMHNWKKLDFPLKYGYGTMFIDMPSFMTMFRKIPSLTGHLGSTGTFLLYAKNLDIYLAGAINQANSPSKPVRLVFKLVSMLKKYFP